jgi:hypothetical protein
MTLYIAHLPSRMLEAILRSRSSVFTEVAPLMGFFISTIILGVVIKEPVSPPHANIAHDHLCCKFCSSHPLGLIFSHSDPLLLMRWKHRSSCIPIVASLLIISLVPEWWNGRRAGLKISRLGSHYYALSEYPAFHTISRGSRRLKGTFRTQYTDISHTDKLQKRPAYPQLLKSHCDQVWSSLSDAPLPKIRANTNFTALDRSTGPGKAMRDATYPGGPFGGKQGLSG